MPGRLLLPLSGLRGRRRPGACPTLLVLLALPVFAAVDGTVMNGTTGKPQPGVVVSLVQPSQGGMQSLGNAATDAEGKFRIDKPSEGMHLIQAIYQGVSYTKMVQPGAPNTGIQVEVYDATKDPAIAKISQHIVFIQPATDQLSINEVYFVKNDSKHTYNNSVDGTLQFYVPAPRAEASSVRVTISAPGGMPLQRPAEATKGAGVFKVNFPVKPGETEFNVAYTMPPGSEFASRNVQKILDTRLVVPRGLTLKGDAVKALGADPSGKVSIYSTDAQSYKVSIEGSAETAAPAEGAEAGAEEDTGAPQVQQTNPRVYGQLPVLLALAAAILLLGLVALYRSGSPKGKTGK